VKWLWFVVAAAAAITLQTTLSRFFIGGTPAVDLVLVVVVYVALADGPVSGLMTGTLAGLAQDALGSGVIGIGALAKTAVGGIVGVISAQFIVSQTVPRFVVFFAASVVHAAMFMGLYELLDLRHFGTPYTSIGAQSLANAVVGLVLFRLVELVPGAMERRHGSHTGLRR
jgi:rod shape-determining protein MreD